MKSAIVFLATILLSLHVFADMEPSTLESLVRSSSTIIIGKIVKLEENKDKDWAAHNDYWWQLEKKAVIEVSQVLRGKSDDRITLTYPEKSEESLRFTLGEDVFLFFNRDTAGAGMLDMKKITIDAKGCVTVYDVKRIAQGETYRSQYISLQDLIERIKKYIGLEALNEKR